MVIYMLYKKNTEKTLLKELFKNPTSEYRCTPFWAWNCNLTQEHLNREIDVMKEMGMGGFHMHSRTGMATPYLTDEFMSLVRGCIEKAKKGSRSSMTFISNTVAIMIGARAIKHRPWNS